MRSKISICVSVRANLLYTLQCETPCTDNITKFHAFCVAILLLLLIVEVSCFCVSHIVKRFCSVLPKVHTTVITVSGWLTTQMWVNWVSQFGRKLRLKRSFNHRCTAPLWVKVFKFRWGHQSQIIYCFNRHDEILWFDMIKTIYDFASVFLSELNVLSLHGWLQTIE